MNNKFTGDMDNTRPKEPIFLKNRDGVPIARCACFKEMNKVARMMYSVENDLIDIVRGAAASFGLCDEGKRLLYAMIAASMISDLSPDDGKPADQMNLQEWKAKGMATIAEMDHFFEAVREVYSTILQGVLKAQRK